MTTQTKRLEFEQKLIQLKQDRESGAITLEDCRHHFPTLTEICAEDICFDNDQCKLPDANTVQEALDQLCLARDLRFHNKHLHGWGIVCGLQVKCGQESPTADQRTHVIVQPGYAIDCEGNDIVLDDPQQIDIAALMQDIATSPPASPPLPLADGEVCLFMDVDENAQRRFRLEPYDPKQDKASLLDGTIWMDFFDGCLFPE